MEYFRDIPGLEVKKLTSSPKYPKTPDEVQKIQVFESSQDRGDHYGARLRTYFLVRVKRFLLGFVFLRFENVVIYIYSSCI